MNDEITQAFGALEYRAHATATSLAEGRGVPDRISLRDHIVTVEIGAFQVERDITQRLSFSVVVEVAPVPEPLEDDVDNILSYDRVTEAIATELAAERLNLLETLADRIATRILNEPQAIRVFVRIEKLDRGPGALGVEIVRSHAKNGMVDTAKSRAARVILLTNAAVQDSGFIAFIDHLLAAQKPMILAVSAPETKTLQTEDAASQRHVDLLGIEQNAWLLAGRDGRVKVVATRTELDWAIKQNQLSVWAPSKLVLSHVDLANTPIQPLDLTVWLAAELGASEVVFIGGEAPNNPDTSPAKLSVRYIPIGGDL